MSIKEAESGEYQGYSYTIKKVGWDEPVRLANMQQSWFCGYVTLPGKHPYNLLEGSFETKHNGLLNCHGGITYDQVHDHDKRVLGFDCNHWGDVHDPKSFEFVRGEIYNIIDQLKEVE